MSILDNRQLKSLQFECWTECNCHCPFCYLGENNNRFTPKESKLKSLHRTLDTLNNPNIIKDYQLIGFIGGEFFQGQISDPEVNEMFFKVMGKTAELYNNGTIKAVWIPATMMIGHQKDLFKTLSLFQNPENVWIITSWDTVGRFKSQKMKDTWLDTIKKIHKDFPLVKINVTSILTQDLIERYMNSEFVFSELMQEWGVSFFFKQCGNFRGDGETDTIEMIDIGKKECNTILPKFFPKRKDFIRFLIKFKNQEPEFMFDRLFNIEYRADDLVRNFNDGRTANAHRYKGTKMEVDDAEIQECGHPVVYRAYCDSDACVLCDKMRIGLFE